MAFFPGDSSIFAPLFSEPQVAGIFSDEQQIARWLEVEGALARAEERLGLIPAGAGQAISQAALGAAPQILAERLRSGVERDGFPIIELVRQLRQLLGEPYSDFVHYGATTQDILDTAMVLQIRAALEIMENQLKRLVANLARLTGQHRNTLMAGRTHSQQALPITFGYKTASWLAPLLRNHRRLAELKPRLLVVQLGGAAGTLAALGERGLEVQAALAEELDLRVPPMPWHTQRDAFAELAGWLSLVTGSLGKMAQDVILLCQSEIGEVRESGDADRGGSSSMPQKSNPVTSEWILAAARANAGLLSSMHQALIHEHERGTHAWQLEWLALPQMIALTAASLKHAAWLSENLQVNTERMLENVRASNGLMLAETLSAALAPSLGQAAAKQLVNEAARTAAAEHRHLVDVVREKSKASLDWDALREEANDLGAAQALIDQVLREVLFL